MTSTNKRMRVGALLIAAIATSILSATVPASADSSDQPPVNQAMQQQSREAATKTMTAMSTSASQDDFINVAGPAAQAVMAEYQVPASVGTAQSILESNWGHSGLSVNDQNYFGFKCVSPTDPGPIATGCHLYSTTECTPSCHTVDAYFRVYASMTDSFRDYGRLLRSNPVYASAFQYTADPDQFAREIATHY